MNNRENNKFNKGLMTIKRNKGNFINYNKLATTLLKN